MNCVHGVRMDRDCRWCATGEEPAPARDNSGVDLEHALRQAKNSAEVVRARLQSQVDSLQSDLARAERERDEARKLLENVVALDDLGKTVPRGAAGAGFQIRERWETTIRRAREVLSRD